MSSGSGAAKLPAGPRGQKESGPRDVGGYSRELTNHDRGRDLLRVHDLSAMPLT